MSAVKKPKGEKDFLLITGSSSSSDDDDDDDEHVDRRIHYSNQKPWGNFVKSSFGGLYQRDGIYRAHIVYRNVLSLVSLAYFISC